MSVTIVSTLPKQTQAVATDSNAPSSDSATTSTDFASLLLGQLLPIVPPVLSDTSLKENLTKTGEETPQDAAGVLASLGLGAVEQGRSIDVKPNSPQDESTVNAIATGTAKSNVATVGVPTQNLVPDETAATKLPDPVTTSDKPAKFAVPAALVAAENTLAPAKNTPSDGATSTQNTLPSFTHSTQIPVSRDVSLSVPTSYRDQGWATDFSQKVVWLASNDKQSAQLTLNPPQMGPIEISLSVDKGNVTASFSSANADVREAIETALPRLREMFANAGISLGQTNVGAESFQQQAGNSSTNYGASQRVPDNAILVANSAGTLPARAFAAQQGNGMVDIFA